MTRRQVKQWRRGQLVSVDGQLGKFRIYAFPTRRTATLSAVDEVRVITVSVLELRALTEREIRPEEA